ncbi:NADH dehydrogenase subunit 5 (mitochondrion) [Daphnia carinata]|uniref:NADH-ubiquinone oxidoreductase chain 5 n=1 Tax=Daphnia carinata TaxID=120202 RepID=A0A0N7CHR6_9CRUS|nr:NADH dehydrogenase subunit 5 [Daphnia carinata]AKL90612.1 NADH dehydrogenase subunit 5 [Daphnia carinata]
MDKFLYQKISFFLMNLMVITWLFGIYLNLNETSIFVEWIMGGGIVNFSATILLDYMSCFFLSVVLCISSNVIWYSKSYMHSDLNANRFIMLVLGFVISMMLLIVSPNILSILLGWDGLGLISYCLVIYYPSKKSSSAGMLTVLSNRVGDVCILLSIGWFTLMGDFNILCWNLTSTLDETYWLPLLVMIAAMTKSAQIPFSAWLPAAMAAPTPVSALVHSSTLVTAGVYLLIRFSFLLESQWSSSLMFISMMTMFMSGIVAICEYDLKKVIALSTLSQLGMMMFAISLTLHKVAFFHLLSHALFKALLFLCAGILIHGIGGSQDMRHFGSLVKSYPMVAVCLNLANFSLCGIPFLAGFYSKDMIVELACQNSWGMFIVIMMFMCLGLTVLYSVRLVFFSFSNLKTGVPLQSLCEEDSTLVYPVVILTLISILSGPSLMWLMFPYPSLILLPPTLKLATIFVISFSIFLMVGLSQISLTQLNESNQLTYLIGAMWFLPWISGQSMTEGVISKSNYIIKILDQGWLEYYTCVVSSDIPNKIIPVVTNTQQNSLKIHFMVFLMWILLLIIFIL